MFSCSLISEVTLVKTTYMGPFHPLLAPLPDCKHCELIHLPLSSMYDATLSSFLYSDISTVVEVLFYLFFNHL